MTSAQNVLLFSLLAFFLIFVLWLRTRQQHRILRKDFWRISRDFNKSARDAQHFRIASENASDGLVVQDLTGRIIWVNPAYCRIMGRPAHQMIGRHPFSFAIPEEERPSKSEIDAFRFDPQTFEDASLSLHRNVRGDGTLFWNQINLSHHIAPDGSETVILVCRDVTQQILKEKRLKDASERLAHMASHDDLTGVANREALSNFAQASLNRLRGTDRRLGVFHVDLDKFKDINDTHGHAAGDAVLKYIAEKLQSVLRKSDMVARIGGDEFIVACPDLRDVNELLTIGRALSESVVVPLRWDDRMISCGISIGASLSDPETTSADTLLQQSDFALYDVKRGGRGRVVAYDEKLSQRHARERGLARDLLQAVRDNALLYHFRPIISMSSDQPIAFETLVTWNHPHLGSLGLADFADIASQTGLRADIDFAAMDSALEMQTRLGPLKVGFNASSDCLAHPQFFERLAAKTELHGLNPQNIIIEIEETSILQSSDRDTNHRATVDQLTQAGYTTLLDEFGMGRAGLGHLAQLKLRAVKIDRALIARAAPNNADERVVNAIYQLCLDLGITVVADGVISPDQASVLQRIGGDTIQSDALFPCLSSDEMVAQYCANTHEAIGRSRSAIAPS